MGLFRALTKLIAKPYAMLAVCLLIAITSLSGAFIAQYHYGLEPCILCIYQRIPFAIVIFFSLMGLMSYISADIARIMMGINALAFLSNAGIAFYHTGVERHWWKSFLEGCAVPDLGSNPETILQTILNTPPIRCDEIPWADPWAGLSMANYNAILCFGMFVACMITLRLSRS